MPLERKDLYKAVGGHIRCRDPGNIKAFSLYFLAQPVLINIDIAKLSIEFRGFLLKDSHYLQVIIYKGVFLLSIKLDCFKEAFPLYKFGACQTSGC